MADIIRGKRFCPEPQVAFPRLTKPASPVNYSLPSLVLSPLTPPFNASQMLHAPAALDLGWIPRTVGSMPPAHPQGPPQGHPHGHPQGLASPVQVLPSRHATPVQTTPQTPQPVPQRGPITPPPSVLPSFKVYASPVEAPSSLPPIPQIAQFMVANRVPASQVNTELPAALPLDKCRSSKDLIEVSKQFSHELSPEQIGRLLDLRDHMFERGGTYVFTFAQFVQFYGFYNMFLTEERSWDPRLSEKFAGSSRTRLRCSCRYSPRLAKRTRYAAPARPCSAAYNMSFWPQQQLVVWECIGVPNHEMRVNAAIGTCQYVENLAHRLAEFSLEDVGVMVRAQLRQHHARLWLDLFDVDRVRSLLRNAEDSSRKEATVEADMALAAELAIRYAAPGIDVGASANGIFISDRSGLQELIDSRVLTLSANFKVCVHFDSVALVTLTTQTGRHGLSAFVPLGDDLGAVLPRVLDEAQRRVGRVCGGARLAPQQVQVAHSVRARPGQAPLPWETVLRAYGWPCVQGSFATCFDGHKVPFTFKHSLAGTALQFTSWLALQQQQPQRQQQLAPAPYQSALCTPPTSDI